MSDKIIFDNIEVDKLNSNKSMSKIKNLDLGKIIKRESMNSILSDRSVKEIQENANPNYKSKIMNLINSGRRKEREM